MHVQIDTILDLLNEILIIYNDYEIDETISSIRLTPSESEIKISTFVELPIELKKELNKTFSKDYLIEFVGNMFFITRKGD